LSRISSSALTIRLSGVWFILASFHFKNLRSESRLRGRLGFCNGLERGGNSSSKMRAIDPANPGVAGALRDLLWRVWRAAAQC
jgi:hypothetical protein